MLRLVDPSRVATMLTVYGFQKSTYVNIVRLVLTHKGVPFSFHDLEDEMGGAKHLALHPFNRVPILDHDGFRVYETSAIVTYIDECFAEPPLQPREPRARARMNQWMGAVNSYYYPWIIFHLVHERLVFPPLGIDGDERIVLKSLPHISLALDVMERELAQAPGFLVGGDPTLADFFMLPSLTALGLTDEGRDMLADRRRIGQWRAQMEALPSVQAFRSAIAPYLPLPIPHARQWATSHRPNT
jgi:glutathione S-transferase